MVAQPVIPALRGLTQGDHEFKASLGYEVRPCLKNKELPSKIFKEFAVEWVSLNCDSTLCVLVKIHRRST